MVKVRISVAIEEKDLIYLKEQGVGRSGFLRQAIQAWKDSKFEYDRLKQ